MDKKKFKGPSADALKNAYSNRGKYPDGNNRKYIFSELGSSKLWTVTDKSHKVRLLPVHPDDNIDFYGMLVQIHTNVGVNGDQYLCLKKMKNKPCPICEQQASLWETEPDMAKQLYPQTRYLVWVVDLSVEKEKQTAQIWSCPRTTMDNILSISYKKATDEILNLADVEDGIPIYFDREKKQGTTFSVYVGFQLDDSPLPAKASWLEEICSFDEIIEYPTYDEVKEVFFGMPTTVTTNEVTETKTIVTKEENKMEIPSLWPDLETIGREELEGLAKQVLSDDYEEAEIEDMGTKKLKRLLLEKKEESNKEIIKESVEDPKEVLKKRLRDRIS